MNTLSRLASIAALLASSQIASAKCLHYDLPAVEIAGKLTRVEAPSPGAEKPEHSWYLEPTRPLCIAAGARRLGNTPFRTVRRFEILLPEGTSLDSFVGAGVVLKGWFVPTQVPHYHHLTFSVESARPGHAP